MSRILFDLFPARVVIAPPSYVDDFKQLTPAPNQSDTFFSDVSRVLTYKDHVFVVADSNQGAYVVFWEPIAESSPSHIVTASGKQLSFEFNDSCGCGSRLKSWNPYRTLEGLLVCDN